MVEERTEERSDIQDVIKIAAEIGAKTAIETLAKERQREYKEMLDRRLRNTKLLLRNYRVFRDHVANAVYEVQSCEAPEDIFAELMMPGKDSSLFVNSIKQSVSRTAVIVKHMETMIQLYKTHCYAMGTLEDERRWRVIYSLYISDIGEQKPCTIAELAKAEGVVERTIYKDIDIACERIAALMFGIDGLRKK